MSVDATASDPSTATPEQYQLFDLLDSGEFDALKADIAKRGVLVPIEFDESGNVLDGHHRLRACRDLGLKDYPTVVRRFSSEDEKEEHVVTLNVRRRHLNGEQKRKWAEWFLRRHPDWSNNRVAAEVGLTDKTVGSVRRGLEATSEIPKSDERVGKNDVRKPASKPTPAPSIFTSARTLDRATDVMQDLGDAAPARQMELKRAERIARENAAEERRQQPVEAVSVDGLVDIRHGDFRKVLSDLPSGSVDAIITDPPYPREFWPLYADLGELAFRVLKPNGVLAVMIGTRLEMLDNVDLLIGRMMRRRHRGIYLTPGPRWRDNTERIATGYKPILIYAHPESEPTELPWLLDDVFSSTGDDKRHHHWGQSESGMASLVERLTAPGALVVDPFLGGGTTALVCRDLDRSFIGCDVDAGCVAASRERVA